MLHFLGLSNRHFCSPSDEKIATSHLREFNSDLDSKLAASISYLRGQLNSIKCNSLSMALKLLNLRCLRSTKDERNTKIIESDSRGKSVFHCLFAEIEGLRRKQTPAGYLTENSVSMTQEFTRSTKDFTLGNLSSISSSSSSQSKPDFDREGLLCTSANNFLVIECQKTLHNSRYEYFIHTSGFFDRRLGIFFSIFISNNRSLTFFPP